tara:strand:+ start:1114 stop:1347 length:234 start_codon:yes stop_codon:yes gene_type:complete
MIVIFELKKKPGQKDNVYYVYQQSSGMKLKLAGTPIKTKGRSHAKALLAGLGHHNVQVRYARKRGPDTENSFVLHGH